MRRHERDECREATLTTGEAIRIRSAAAPSPEDAAALTAIVAAARARHAAEHPDLEQARALWSRIDAARGDLLLRGVAYEAGVTIGALFRLIQGNMPDEADKQTLERWLEELGLPGP
jgi:hypothetical protein